MLFYAVLIWYTGHGEKNTGNWVFEDGYLAFKAIYDLYVRYFKGRYLYIVTDCCYSGAWVVECARLLDRDGVKCSHDAKDSQMYIKVFAACLPSEAAYDMFYTQCKGVKLQSYFADYSKTIEFAEHRRLHKGSDYSQTTLGVDFTENDSMCILNKDGKCTRYATWTEYLERLIKQDSSHSYLV